MFRENLTKKQNLKSAQSNITVSEIFIKYKEVQDYQEARITESTLYTYAIHVHIHTTVSSSTYLCFK